MVRCSLLLLAASSASAGITLPAAAQDYVGHHIEAQQEARIRQHQQGRASTPPNSNAASSKYRPPIEGKALHAAMRRHHQRYAEIMRERGYRAADQWLTEKVAAGR